MLAGADLAMGARVLARLKQASRRMCRGARDTPGLKVTLSIGIATRPRGGTIAATIAAADQALYDAKAAGRDRIATEVALAACVRLSRPASPACPRACVSSGIGRSSPIAPRRRAGEPDDALRLARRARTAGLTRISMRWPVIASSLPTSARTVVPVPEQRLNVPPRAAALPAGAR